MIRLSIVLLMALAMPTHAQHQHSTSQPTETGQSAFAALAEIVDLLRDDPHTDWQTVNIPALREHLVDMDLLLMETTVEAEILASSVAFTITGEERTIETIHRMVPAHAPFLDQETGWVTTVDAGPDGAVMTIAGEAEIVAALGFHGVMTIGAHHHEHHLAIASGGSVHH